MNAHMRPVGPSAMQWSLQQELQAGPSLSTALSANGELPKPSPDALARNERLHETLLQQASLPAEATQALAASSLTAMALSSLHGNPAQWRQPAAQEERHKSRPQQPAPEEETEASSAPDTAPPLRGTPAPAESSRRYGQLTARLREAAHFAPVTQALQQLGAGRPVLLVAPAERVQGPSGAANAWLLKPQGATAAGWRGQLLLARRPADTQWWGWRAVADQHPQGGAQWRARDAVAGCELWLGPLAQAAAWVRWREALVCLPAAPTLRQALGPLHSLAVLLTTMEIAS